MLNTQKKKKGLREETIARKVKEKMAQK